MTEPGEVSLNGQHGSCTITPAVFEEPFEDARVPDPDVAEGIGAEIEEWCEFVATELLKEDQLPEHIRKRNGSPMLDDPVPGLGRKYCDWEYLCFALLEGEMAQYGIDRETRQMSWQWTKRMSPYRKRKASLLRIHTQTKKLSRTAGSCWKMVSTFVYNTKDYQCKAVCDLVIKYHTGFVNTNTP